MATPALDTRPNAHQGARILLVEDNPADVQLTASALEESGARVALDVAEDGLAALEFLQSSAEPRPDLVLLDLNMPRMNGSQVLSAMKSDVALRTIPVIVFSSSDAPSDIAACYDGHANGYMTKPLDYGDLVELMDRLRQFWLESSRLPSSS